MKVFTLILLLATFFAFEPILSQPAKKVVIQLFEDGTWEKVGIDQTTQGKPDIENTWKSFQDAVKSRDKSKITNYFDFPFDIDVCGSDESKDYSSLKGSFSKKKLLDKYNLLFDMRFTDAILKVSADEYSKHESYNAYIFDFVKSERTELVYEIQFYLIKNTYKIGAILIGYGK